LDHPVGHMISLNLSDDNDVSLRRQSLVGQINTVLCRFGRLDPTVIKIDFSRLTTLIITVLNYGIWIVIKSRSTARPGGMVWDEFGNCYIRFAVITCLQFQALVRYMTNCVGIFLTLLQSVFLALLSLFVSLLGTQFIAREYSHLSVVITCCVTRDMVPRFKTNLGLVSNLHDVVTTFQWGCCLSTAVVLLLLLNWFCWLYTSWLRIWTQAQIACLQLLNN